MSQKREFENNFNFIFKWSIKRQKKIPLFEKSIIALPKKGIQRTLRSSILLQLSYQ